MSVGYVALFIFISSVCWFWSFCCFCFSSAFSLHSHDFNSFHFSHGNFPLDARNNSTFVFMHIINTILQFYIKSSRLKKRKQRTRTQDWTKCMFGVAIACTFLYSTQSAWSWYNFAYTYISCKIVSRKKKNRILHEPYEHTMWQRKQKYSVAKCLETHTGVLHGRKIGTKAELNSTLTRNLIQPHTTRASWIA